MSESLDGRVCIVTGAGNGLGREHALLLAAEGARVVVNDVGVSVAGVGSDQTPANETVEMIRAAGGEAVANTDSVADWDSAGRIVEQAIEAFGDLHVVVNNAGVVYHRDFVDLTREEFERVIGVHLTGHFATMHRAARYWRGRLDAGKPVAASIVNTASGTMLGGPRLADYAAAKAGIAAATVSLATELADQGVRVNCIVPISRSRLARPTTAPLLAAPDDPSVFDMFHPGNVSPLVAYLATESCPFTGGVFHVTAHEVGLLRGWSMQEDDVLRANGRWTMEELQEQAPRLLEGRRPSASQMLTIEETFPRTRPG